MQEETLLQVLLPYRFTLFSNRVTVRYIVERVLLPYRFTLFSNKYNSVGKPFVFYYLIDLHYSQTIQQCKANTTTFYYLIDLHYSQTVKTDSSCTQEFYYLIDLHYSQT